MNIANISRKYRILALGILAVILFFAYSYLRFDNPYQRYSWPDEMSNAVFIETFRQDLVFTIPEPRNEIAGNIIHPRSVNVYLYNLVPIGFLGLPLIYGAITKITFGIFAADFLTPALAVLAVFYFYKLIFLIFDRRTALLSAGLLAIQPAFFYYANFSLLPNVPFISLFIIGIYFLAAQAIGPSKDEVSGALNTFLSGLFLSLAIIIRPNEIVWLTPILIVLMIALYRGLKNKKIILLWFAPMILLAMVYLFFNQQTYGGYFRTGYEALSGGSAEIAGAALPFGFNLSNIVRNVFLYVIKFHWWQTSWVILGSALLLYKGDKIKWQYFGLTALAGAIIFIYYGSWQLADSLILQLGHLGISYHRYFLPFFIFSLPLMAMALLTILDLPVRYRKFLFGALLAGSAYFFLTEPWQGNDGLGRVKESIATYNAVHQSVLALTQENAVTLTERGDKIVFPQRAVISQFKSDEVANLKALSQISPIYYLTGPSVSEVEERWKSDLTAAGLSFTNKQTLQPGYDLYEIK